MSTIQIALLLISGVFSVVSIVFMFMFVIEIFVTKDEEFEETEVRSIFSSDEYVKQAETENVDSMLAKLDEQADETANQVNVTAVVVEETKEEPAEAKVEPVVVEEVKAEPVEEVKEEIVEEVKAEPVEEVVEEVKAEPVEEVKEETVEEVKAEPVEEVVEEAKAELVEETKEEVVEEVSENEEPVEENNATVTVSEPLPLDSDMISIDNLPDYKTRLETVVENRDKINKDLIKIEKSILNYERTKRRKIRNQKMLDRRASELTNLNLVMYSVTDIKNVDEEKKVKQEELTSHIAELKASIQDAEEFLDSNKEKNEHDLKMAKFLIQEKARYNEEIAELEKLIDKIEGSVA